MTSRLNGVPEVYTIEPYDKFWAVYERPNHLLIEEALSGEPEKKLVTVCVYKKGAEEITSPSRPGSAPAASREAGST